ncbi:Cell division and transport-associated protein TolA [Psychromonas ingrahamii 37]|uniref:Cell division and transport-associated protein TolA n=1 Tax=Psychromonas ingrahamii (strain DSM 17664 / CCUG 51855 / 37) TaxID=357804 RepID=A1SSW3_PSYIN|nr:cell envelope integrity protein TolA [Psychromonas ingrahamii]ABM02578.1 Cell division and transport-associated protein TolA [Psychromonas ingrahamii 37]
MKNRSTLIAFIGALLMHIIVGTLLLLNVNFSNPKIKPKNEVPIINATVVDQKLLDNLAQRQSEKKQAERKKVEQEKQRIEQEKKKAAERVAAEKKQAAEKLKAKQDAEKAKKVAAEKAAAEKVAAEKVAAEKVAAEKVAAEKAAAEKAAAEKAAAEKAAAEKAAAEKAAAEKAAAAAKVKAEQEKERLRRAELDKQMDAQFEDTFSNAQSSRQLSEIARYTALIQDKIGRNWQIEPSMKGKSCTLSIRLAADGLVISAKRSSGDIQLCESAKRAALKANTLPIPKDPDISAKFRDFDLNLKPEF